MPDHHLAFADLMQELLAQSPDKPSESPSALKSEEVLEDKTDEVLRSLIGDKPIAVDEAVKTDTATMAAMVSDLTETPAVPQVVSQVEEKEAASPPSGFYAAVARFKAMRGDS